MRTQDQRRKGFAFTKEICLGDVIQVILLACSAIWFFAHMDAQISGFGRELDELHTNVGALRTDVDVLKTHVADVVDRRP